jgi:RES domain-containing protein
LIIASRLCRPAHAGFDGAGGLLREGRWHERGHRVVYAADSEALAALEILVHLSSLGQFPEHVCIKASIPESFVLDIRDFDRLGSDWNRRDPGETRAIGTRWLLDGSSAVMKVPSMVVPRESNFMLNPAHPRFHEIELSKPFAFEFDIRLLARTQ